MNVSDTFYNKLELPRPHLHSFKYTDGDSEELRKNIWNTLDGAIKCLQSLATILSKETAIINKLVSKNKIIKRHDKGFQHLSMLKRSLHQYKALDLRSVLEAALRKSTSPHIPSQQVLEWVLVRIQGFVKLLDNICHRSMQVAKCMKWKFQRSHDISISVVVTAAVSRVWVISVYFLKNSSKWYKALVDILPALDAVPQPWLPVGYEFPESIEKWLGNPEYLEQQPNIEIADMINLNSSVSKSKVEEDLNVSDLQTESENTNNEGFSMKKGKNKQLNESVNVSNEESDFTEGRESENVNGQVVKHKKKRRKSKQPIENEDVNKEVLNHIKKRKRKHSIESGDTNNEEVVPRKKRKSKELKEERCNGSFQ